MANAIPNEPAASAPLVNPEAESRFGLGSIVLLVLPMVLFWLLVIDDARGYWGSESYYNFGWAVPLLGIYLFYRRFGKPPPTGPVIPALRTLVFGGALVAAVLLFPIRWYGEANVLWQPPLFAQALLASAVTVGLLTATGGKKWFLAAFFPTLYLLTMLPWPFDAENLIIQKLTQWVTFATEGVLMVLGYPAEAQGNTIFINNEPVEVDEACSGIRSFQALVMVSIFLGEFFRLNILNRLILLVGSIILGLFLNTIRTVILSVVIINGEENAYDTWHDPLGYVSFGLALLIAYVFSELLLKTEKAKPDEAADAPAKTGLQLPPRPLLLTLSLMVPIAFVAIEGWYRFHERDALLVDQLYFDWASDVRAYDQLEISDTVVDMLAPDEITRAEFFEGAGRQEVYHYTYDGTDMRRSAISWIHEPTLCMTASGARLLNRYEPLGVRIGELQLPFAHYVFTMSRSAQPGRQDLMHVFFSSWNPHDLRQLPLTRQHFDRAFMLRQALEGRRLHARTVVLLSVTGVRTVAEARNRADALLSERIIHQSVQSAPLEARAR